jgi:hypothetical protein
MSDFSQYQHIGTRSDVDYYLVDHDIILIVPQKDFLDNPERARESADFQDSYARQLGRKCGDVVVMANILSQDAATRRVYSEQAANGLYYGVALIVDNALSRALASFLIGMTKTVIPMKLFDTTEKGIVWLQTIRPS